MSIENRVLWTEGLFLCPQTFQQQERYLMNQIESRSAPLVPYYWGISEYAVDEDKLKHGIFSLLKCNGIFPDGTPFDISGELQELNIDDTETNKFIYIALGAKHPDSPEVTTESDREKHQTRRFYSTEGQVNDIQTIDSPQKTEQLHLGRLNIQLILSETPKNNFSQIPLAFLKERDKNSGIKLDDSFIPALLSVNANKVLREYLANTQNLLSSRGNELSSRLSTAGTGGIAEIIDFNMLQALNRNIPLYNFLNKQSILHPRELYIHLAKLAGELSTFTRIDRMPVTYPDYVHDDLKTSFELLMADLHESLTYINIPKAYSLNLEINERFPNIYSGLFPENVLETSKSYVLAVSSSLRQSEILNRIPAQITISAKDQLYKLVQSHTPGITLDSLAVCPREIPYHQGYVYFTVNNSHAMWKDVNSTRSIALHIDGKFPDLQLEFWAIRAENHE